MNLFLDLFYRIFDLLDNTLITTTYLLARTSNQIPTLNFIITCFIGINMC